MRYSVCFHSCTACTVLYLSSCLTLELSVRIAMASYKDAVSVHIKLSSYEPVWNSVDIGTSTTASPALDIDALCVSSRLAAISAEMLMSVSTRVSPYHDSLRYELAVL